MINLVFRYSSPNMAPIVNWMQNVTELDTVISHVHRHTLAYFEHLSKDLDAYMD